MKKRHYELIVLVLFMAAGVVLLRNAIPKNVLNPAFSSEYIRPYDVPIIVISIIMVLCLQLLITNIVSGIKEKREAASKAASQPAVEAVKESNGVESLAEEMEAASRKVDEAGEKSAADKKKEYITLLLIIAYVFAWKYLGFYIATPVYVFVNTLILPEKRSVKMALISAAATTAICYVVFTLLFQIRFPFPLFK